MNTFDLVKVIDPQKHMPEEVKDAFMNAEVNIERSNDSFVHKVIGQWKTEEDDIVANWLNQNFEKGEKVIILFWW